jgi:hypothetical protein
MATVERLILVRHAMPELVPEMPAESWHLGAEVRRPHVWSDDSDYRAMARAYVGGVRHDGLEPHDEVFARFESAVVRHASLAAAQRRTLVVGTHGLAPTVWLSRRVRLEPSPAQFWEQLRFPDLVEVDLSAGRWFRRA